MNSLCSGIARRRLDLGQSLSSFHKRSIVSGRAVHIVSTSVRVQCCELRRHVRPVSAIERESHFSNTLRMDSTSHPCTKYKSDYTVGTDTPVLKVRQR